MRVVRDSSPAAVAGVAVGDALLALNDNHVDAMSASVLRRALCEYGVTVRLRVARAGRVLAFSFSLPEADE